MNFALIALILLICMVNFSAEIARNLLLNEFDSKNATESLTYVMQWRQQFKNDIQKSLKDFPTQFKNKLLAEADEENAKSWPSLKASDFLLFVKTGDRHIYESSILRRRARFAKLLIGELLSNQGKYMDQIADGVWLMVEESTWIAPAHLGSQKAKLGLPDPEVIKITGIKTKNSKLKLKFLFNHKINFRKM